MSSMNGVLQQLDRVNSEAVSRHHQRPKERVCSSSLTLTRKGEGHTIDDSDHSIAELTELQHKGTLLWNGCAGKCISENTLRTKEAVVLNGAESRSNIDFLNSADAHLAVTDPSSPVSRNTSLKNPPDWSSSSESSRLQEALDTSTNLQSMNAQKTSHVLHVTGQPSLSSDSVPLLDQKDVTHSARNHTSQFLSSVPTHTRSLSQTTSQLTSLIESGSVGDKGYVDTLHVKALSDTCDIMHLENVSDTPSLDKPQICPCDASDLRAVQDTTSYTEEGEAPDILDAKEDFVFKSSAEPSQCFGEVPQSSSLEPEPEVPFLTHSSFPDWKLDRRDSGHLFWRRDSSTLNGIDPRSRVKFRYDIEVREFESRNSEVEELADDDYEHIYEDDDDDEDDDEEGVNKRCVTDLKGRVRMTEESPSVVSPEIMCVVAVLAIIAMASYRWLLSALSLI